MLRIIMVLHVLLIVNGTPSLPFHTMNIYGNTSMGYYYVNLYFGRPSQVQSVIIDTGSGILTTPCNKCQACGPNHINRYFQLQKSKSSKLLTCASKAQVCKQLCNSNFQQTKGCDFSISYAQGSSLKGIYLQDYVQLEDKSYDEAVRAVFGCTTQQTNLFLKQQANGIFGLSPQRSNLLESIFKEHSTITSQKFQFSICLSSNGGILTVGGVNKTLHRQLPIRTTYNPIPSNLYTLDKVGNMRVGENVFHRVGDNQGFYGVFIDSGSTFTYFPQMQYNLFKQVIDNICTKSNKCQTVAMAEMMSCYRLAGEQKPTQEQFITDLQSMLESLFPPIEIDINQRIVKWYSVEYFVLRSRKHREVCLGVSALDRFLLGANWMVNKDILFNNQQNYVEIYPNSVCKEEEKQSTVNMKQSTSSQKDGKTIKQTQSSKTKLAPISKVAAQDKFEPLKIISNTFNVSIQTIIIVIGVIILVKVILVIGWICYWKSQMLRNSRQRIQAINQEEAMTKSTKQIDHHEQEHDGHLSKQDQIKNQDAQHTLLQQ